MVTERQHDQYLAETGRQGTDKEVYAYYYERRQRPDDTSFTKHDNGKPQLSFPVGMTNAMAAISEVMTFGAAKYERDNWKKASSSQIHRYLDAALRHLSSHCANDLTDPESGLPHIHHALTSLAMYVDLYTKENNG